MTTAVYIRTGAMRHRATLQTESQTPDGGGGYSVTWETERRMWCQIKPLIGSERLEAMQREFGVTHEIFARYQADVDPDILTDKRILYKSFAYTIKAAWSPMEWPEFVHMVAVRGAAT